MKVLSAVKEEVEAGASPVMRKVFAVLFPFDNAGWNAGINSVSKLIVYESLTIERKYWERFISARKTIDMLHLY